jgi:hypothetical protein
MVYKIVLAILFVLFQVGDILLTEQILRNGGVELNPLVKRFGYWIKIPGSVLAIAFGFIVSPIIMVPPLVIMIGVCVWNFIQFRRM